MAGRGFDLDQRLVAVQPPTFTYRGRTYTGRLLSWEQTRALGAAIVDVGHALTRGDANAEAQLRALAVETCRTLFPRPPWWALRHPPAHVLAARLHTTDLFDMLMSFSAALARTLPGAPAPETTSRTTMGSTRSGGDSPTSS